MDHLYGFNFKTPKPSSKFQFTQIEISIEILDGHMMGHMINFS